MSVLPGHCFHRDLQDDNSDLEQVYIRPKVNLNRFENLTSTRICEGTGKKLAKFADICGCLKRRVGELKLTSVDIHTQKEITRTYIHFDNETIIRRYNVYWFEFLQTLKLASDFIQWSYVKACNAHQLNGARITMYRHSKNETNQLGNNEPSSTLNVVNFRYS